MKPFEELNDIHASDEQKQATYDYVMQYAKKPKRNWKPQSAVALCSLCMCFFYVCYSFLATLNREPSSPVVAYVSFDINPSFEMQLDKDNNVIKTIAYNKDGDAIISSVDVIGKYIDDAIDVLLKNKTYIQYLNDGILEVSVYSKIDGDNGVLYQKINEHLGYTLEDTQYHCSKVNQEEYDDAMQHHTSAGKYRIITQIQAYDPSYTLEKLKGYNMKELYALLTTYIDESDAGGMEGSDDTSRGNGYHHGK